MWSAASCSSGSSALPSSNPNPLTSSATRRRRAPPAPYCWSPSLYRFVLCENFKKIRINQFSLILLELFARNLVGIFIFRAQNLANLVEFGGKEPYMCRVNSFIVENKTKMIDFIDRIADHHIPVSSIRQLPFH